MSAELILINKLLKLVELPYPRSKLFPSLHEQLIEILHNTASYIANFISNFGDSSIPMLRQLTHTPYTDLEPIADPGEVSGFQSPAANYREDRLNILQRLVTDPLNTFYFEANSDEMELFGIKQGTLLVVDRSKIPAGGMLVVARYKGDWLVRQLISHVSRQYLSTGRENDEIIEVGVTSGPLIWGVITWACLPMTEQGEFSEL